MLAYSWVYDRPGDRIKFFVTTIFGERERLLVYLVFFPEIFSVILIVYNYTIAGLATVYPKINNYNCDLTKYVNEETITNTSNSIMKTGNSTVTAGTLVARIALQSPLLPSGIMIVYGLEKQVTIFDKDFKFLIFLTTFRLAFGKIII